MLYFESELVLKFYNLEARYGVSNPGPFVPIIDTIHCWFQQKLLNGMCTNGLITLADELERIYVYILA